MATVRLRVRGFEKLESTARAQAEQRAAQRLRLQAAGTRVPPPDADLLGMWQVVEERFVTSRECVENDLGRFFLRFEVLTPDRTLFGTYEVSDFVLKTGRFAGTRWPHTAIGIIDGRLPAPGRVRCRMLPQEGNHLRQASGGVIMIGELMEATLDGGTMDGVFENDRIGMLAEFRAVKLEDGHP